MRRRARPEEGKDRAAEDVSATLDLAAEAVADRSLIDWDRLAAESPEAAPALARLRAIAGISAACVSGAEPHPPGANAPARFVWGHLEVLERVGEGSWGEIYRAFDPVLEREVALKLVRRARGKRAPGPAEKKRMAESERRALYEARRLARVRHPNVLAVHGADVQAGRVGIWTDLLTGRTLEERLAAEGPLGAEEAARIGIDLCRALAAVHRAGLLHGDVKATNVIEEEGGAIVLVDFGSGRALEEVHDLDFVTGTPLALAPEVLLGDRPDASADIYALGMLLYRLASGRYAVEAVSLAELRAKHRSGTSVPLGVVRPDLPPPFIRAVERALAPRALRCSDAAAMEQILADALLEITAPVFGARTARADAHRVRESREIPHNLAAALTSFVGREPECEAIAALIAGKRLVTLTGAGGTGKTRLALEVGFKERPRFADGVWMVELAAHSDPGAVPRVVARAIGCEERPDEPIEDTLNRILARKSLLLILDNCEHLRGASADLASELIQRCPGVHVLATSREDLGVEGETVYHLAPLLIPPPDVDAPDELVGYPSVRLLVDRAGAADAHFRLTADNAATITQICRRLDGIPLALELVAARVRALPIEEIADRLEDRLALLSVPGTAVLPHHQTLRALITWSYELLPSADRALFRRLSVFAGGWTLGAAESLCAVAGFEAADVIGVLANLVGKSLVERDGRARYRMLETIRQFAGERATAEGEWAALARRHRLHFLAMAEEGALHLERAEQQTWLVRLSAEHENLATALESTLGEDPDLETGLRLATALGPYWFRRGHWSEARAVCERLLGHPAAQAQSSARARALIVAGDLALRQGDPGRASAKHEEALAIARASGDRAGIALALGKLGNIRVERGDYAEARAMFEESRELRMASGDRWGVASITLNLGRVSYMQGRMAEAKAAFTDSLTIARELGHRWGITAALGALGNVTSAEEDYPAARAYMEESLAIARDLGDPNAVAHALYNLGIVANHLGDAAASRAYFEESRVIHHDLGEARGEAMALQSLGALALGRGEHEVCRALLLDSLRCSEEIEDARLLSLVLTDLGTLAIATGDPERGLRLHAGGAALRHRIGAVLRPDQERPIAEAKAAAWRALGTAAEAIWAEWQAKPLPEVIAYANAGVPRP
jgi:predicted ATPase